MTVLAFAAVPGADAATYCGTLQGPYGTCQGSYESLNANVAVAGSSTFAACAGARATNGVFYGQYFCASNYACHTYGGGTLAPMAHSHENFSQFVFGRTNGNTAGLDCPRGGPVSARSVASKTAFRRAAGSIVRTFRVEGQLCLNVADGATGFGVTCRDADDARDDGLVPVLRPARRVTGEADTESGVLVASPPADTNRATLRNADGESRPVSARDGVIVTTPAAGDSTLRWEGDASRQSLP
ncbi:MAG TPA: hypothetical protein VN238_06075 [Solirubrobacteraceae bacterium]|nr:hypothetical protein [Solirubrobacteraceae bacterium]